MQNDPSYGEPGGVDPTSTPLPANESTPAYIHHGQGEHSHKHHHGFLGFHLHRHYHEGGEQEHEHSPSEEMHEQHPQHDLMHTAQSAQ